MSVKKYPIYFLLLLLIVSILTVAFLMSDIDNDGLSIFEELRYGTHYNNPDSDGDGLKDGEEIRVYGTDPLKIDSDHDDLNDSMEINLGSDPLDADSDGDGLYDGYEFNYIHTDPLKADSDEDGLSDKVEVQNYNTDPLTSDMDGDGLLDGKEVIDYKTNPRKADTDNDGLNDYEEIYSFGTDPLNPDMPFINFGGFRLMQNGTHLIIEDYASDWAPYYYISLENGTRLFALTPYEAENSIVAEYAYVSRSYAKEIYLLEEIFERFPNKSLTYTFEIYTHNREYDFIIIGNETQKILFGDYEEVIYLPSFSFGNTVYDVVFEGFNETVFQYVKEQVFGDDIIDDLLDKAWRLVEWADSNIQYDHFKALFPSRIYDPITFIEEKSGVCIDYAVFYASGILAAGLNESYVFVFDVGNTSHAIAGMKYKDYMFVLEQHLPVMELQDYIQFSEIIWNESINSPKYTYKITCFDNDVVVEFCKLNFTKYEDSHSSDGITDEFVKEVALRLSQKLNARISNTKMPHEHIWRWGMLRFYTPILHEQWIEYISDLIADELIVAGFTPQYIHLEKIDDITLSLSYS